MNYDFFDMITAKKLSLKLFANPKFASISGFLSTWSLVVCVSFESYLFSVFNFYILDVNICNIGIHCFHLLSFERFYNLQ